MKRILLFSSIIIAVFISLTVNQSYAKLDVLREVNDLVKAGRPNVLIVLDHNRAMAGSYAETGVGGATHFDDSDSSARFFQLKDVMRGLKDGSSGGSIKPEDAVLETTKGLVNYGFMSFEQFNYWPYYTTIVYSGSPTNCQATPAACEGVDPVITMDPVANNGTFPGTSFTYNSAGGHVGTAGTAAPVDGTTYYHYKYAAGSPINSDPITFNGGNIGANEGTMRGGKVWIDIDPTAADPTWNIDYIKPLFKLGNKGGLVVSGNSAKVEKMFRNSTAPADNVWDYFLNDVLPDDSNNTAACFTKNYIIFLSSGTTNSGNWSANANGSIPDYLEDLKTGIPYNGNTFPVKTFVIGFIDTDTTGGGLRANLNDAARYGGTDANDSNGLYGLNPSADTNFGADPDDESDDVTSCSGTEDEDNGTPEDESDDTCNDFAFFVKNATELKDVFEKIIKTISGGDFVTGAPSATSSGGSFVLNDVGILASTEYPEWRGHLRAVDLINNQFWWDAGVTLFVDAAKADLPKAVVNANVADKDASWRDTDGDGAVDQPPLTITVGSDTYQYTDKVLYCMDDDAPNNNYGTSGDNCVSSALASNEYVGTTVTFKISGTNIKFHYVGAFYMPPWVDRKVYTSQLTGSKLNFTTTNWSAINTLAGWGVGEDEAKAIINFALGGVDSNKDGTVEEAKEWWLGDITNVVSIGVGSPIDPKDGLTGRSTFREDFANRSTVIYTGSNDQMLHAYDFATGNELFAYIPPDLLANLKTLYENAMDSPNPAGFMGQPADPTNHIYGIANSPKVNDFQFADGTWHTVLVTGEGPRGSNYVAGNNHYFALDITHPNGSSDYSGSSAFTQRYPTTAPFDILWHTKETALETTYSYSTKLGETWSVPAFGRLQDGADNKWVVFAGSGYDDTTYSDEKGRTYNVINVEDGSLIQDILSSEVVGTTSVQFGLLPDSVSIIKKTGSRVYTSYQVDLVGRIWHLDTTSSTTSNWTSAWASGTGGYNSLEKTSGDADRRFNPSNTKPFYYSPAVWDFDNTSSTALNLMVLGTGAYDDEDYDHSGLTDSFYFLIVDPATSQITDAITVTLPNVTGTSVVDTEGNAVAAPNLSTARLLASPVLFNNRTSNSLEALFLIFVPPTSAQLGCSFGASYLLVFDLGSPDTFSGTTSTFDTSAGSTMKDVMDNKAKFVVSMGSGKVSGIGIAGGGSHAVVGQSGYGGGDTSGFITAGGSSWNPIGTVTKLFWKEVN